jgi:DNA-binding protein HU-beta
MNKAELIESVYADFQEELTKRLSGQIVESIFEHIIESIRSEERFSYPGFGIFVLRKRKARKARNPRTGEKIRVKASKSVGFKASKVLRQRM